VVTSIGGFQRAVWQMELKGKHSLHWCTLCLEVYPQE
jgi:hypothetical protein